MLRRWLRGWWGWGWCWKSRSNKKLLLVIKDLLLLIKDVLLLRIVWVWNVSNYDYNWLCCSEMEHTSLNNYCIGSLSKLGVEWDGPLEGRGCERCWALRLWSISSGSTSLKKLWYVGVVFISLCFYLWSLPNNHPPMQTLN